MTPPPLLGKPKLMVEPSPFLKLPESAPVPYFRFRSTFNHMHQIRIIETKNIIQLVSFIASIKVWSTRERYFTSTFCSHLRSEPHPPERDISLLRYEPHPPSTDCPVLPPDSPWSLCIWMPNVDTLFQTQSHIQ